MGTPEDGLRALAQAVEEQRVKDHDLDSLYPDAVEVIKEALHPPARLDLRVRNAWQVIQHRDGLPRQDVRGQGIAPVTINVIASSGSAQMLTQRILRGEGIAPVGGLPPSSVEGPYRELGPALSMPQDATGRPTVPLQQAEASQIPQPNYTHDSPAGAPAEAVPSKDNLYGFDASAPADGPGAAPNSRETRYAQRQAQLRALMEQQG